MQCNATEQKKTEEEGNHWEAARYHNLLEDMLVRTVKEPLNLDLMEEGDLKVEKDIRKWKKKIKEAETAAENATGFAASYPACVINCSGCISCTLCPHSTLPFQVQFGWKSPCCPLQRGNISPNKSDASHPTPTELFVGSCPSSSPWAAVDFYPLMLPPETVVEFTFWKSSWSADTAVTKGRVRGMTWDNKLWSPQIL